MSWGRSHSLGTASRSRDEGASRPLGILIGARVFYLLEHDPGALLAPDRLVSGNGFTFDGGVILAALLIAAYVHRSRLSARYLDAGAAGLPLGVAIGRIGDVINGEHYGERSDFLLAVSNSPVLPRQPRRRAMSAVGAAARRRVALCVFRSGRGASAAP